MTPTPFSWTKPPLPDVLSVPGYTFSVPRERIWHRALWASEPSHALSSFLQPGFSDVLCACQISTQLTTRSLSISHLKQAVRLLRFEQPAIASRLAWPGVPSPHVPPDRYSARLVYEELGTDEEVMKWVDEVVLDRTAVMDKAHGSLTSAVDLVLREVGQGFDSPPATSFNVYFVAASGSQAALIVRGSHALFDAFGLVKCMDRLVAKISQLLGNEHSICHTISWGEEVGNLVGPAVNYTKVPWSSEGETSDNVMIQNVDNVVSQIKSTCGLPVPNPSAQASTTAIFVRSFPKVTLDRILSATRSHRCTFYAVVFASMVLAVLRVNPPVASDGLAVPVLFTPVNLRHKGLIDRDDSMLSALGYNVVVAKDLARFVHTSPLTDDVWVIAREIGAQMQEQQDQLPKIGLWAHGFISHIMDIMAERRKSRDGQSAFSVTPRVSSLGVIDGYLAQSHDIPNGGLLSVSNPIVSVCIYHDSPVQGHMIGVHSFTWHGTSYMCIGFPEAFMGTLQDQKEYPHKYANGSVWAWSEEFMKLLESIAES